MNGTINVILSVPINTPVSMIWSSSKNKVIVNHVNENAVCVHMQVISLSSD